MAQRYIPDALDRAIITLLTTDGRLSASEVALRIGTVSERTVRNRISALIQNRLIVIGALQDPTAMGREFMADLIIEVAPGRLEEVAQALAAFEEVHYLAAMSGPNSLIASITLATHKQLLDFSESTVAGIPGVVRITSNVILRMYKTFGVRTSVHAAAAAAARG